MLTAIRSLDQRAGKSRWASRSKTHPRTTALTQTSAAAIRSHSPPPVGSVVAARSAGPSLPPTAPVPSAAETAPSPYPDWKNSPRKQAQRCRTAGFSCHHRVATSAALPDRPRALLHVWFLHRATCPTCRRRRCGQRYLQGMWHKVDTRSGRPEKQNFPPSQDERITSVISFKFL